MSRTTYLALAVATRVLTDLPLLWMFVAIHFAWRADGGVENALWNAVAFLAWAVLHSVLARDTARRLASRWVGPDLVRIAYVLVAGLTLAALLLAWRPVSGEVWHAIGAAAWVLSALYVASLVALVAITFHFDYAEFLGLRRIEDRVAGRRHRSAALSVEGPYAYCRHPMYLAMLAAFWVGPVMTFGRLEFALLSTLYLLVGLRLEERNLRQELGPEYDLYRSNVPMLIPRLTAWHAPADTAEPRSVAASGARS
ncbi:MAG TPA: isoprenylcysteine carboxylmethyltransferase family protein [Vicinamibacteria bacterium]|nr:isoprenylcysteine carboxylmethyltransferase family protein [Vicinamibacteria bacterium]